MLTKELAAILAILLVTGSARDVLAQDIRAYLTSKMAPEKCPGECVQVFVRNQTREPEELEMRRPGGNWLSFTLQPGSRYNYRCHDCTGALEARLPDGDTVSIAPGADYELKYDSSRQVLLAPRRAW